MKLIVQFAKEYAMIVYQQYRGFKFNNTSKTFFSNNRMLSSASCPENALSRGGTFFVRGENKTCDWALIRISDYHKKIVSKMVKAYNAT